jgi:hypothetical protein
MDRTPLWPFILSLTLLSACAMTFAWLGYACTADTPPECPLDPGFEWTRDSAPLQPPDVSRQLEVTLPRT